MVTRPGPSTHLKKLCRMRGTRRLRGIKGLPYSLNLQRMDELWRVGTISWIIAKGARVSVIDIVNCSTDLMHVAVGRDDVVGMK